MENDSNKVQAMVEQDAKPLDHDRVVAERSRRLVRSEPDEAQQLLRHALESFTIAGSELEAAVAIESVAEIAHQWGGHDEALRTADAAGHHIAPQPGEGTNDRERRDGRPV